jgi:hypothetical protein
MQSFRSASNPPATEAGVLPRTRRLGFPLVKLRRYFPNLNDALCRWFAILGSLREHTRIQFSTRAVDLGPSFLLHRGNWIPNTRTTACAEGIKRLQATRPKADVADVQMFLAGFDAGERYALDHADLLPRNNQDAQHIQPQQMKPSESPLS